MIEGIAPSIWIALVTLAVLLIGFGLVLGKGGPRDARGRRRFRLRPVRRLFGLLLLALACVTGLFAATLYQFFRLTSDEPVAVVELREQGPRQFVAAAELPGKAAEDFTLRGDEWQIDARMVRWRLPALLAGVPPLYRLERLSGRYTDAAADQSEPRTVYALAPSGLPDLVKLKQRFPNWLPFVDVVYGSAAYMPMFDGARYRVFVDPRGALFIRPDNAATADALKQRGW
ncbi:hypothetical protein [Bordetella bronchialis]|uniref:Cation/multidrug efflux pump n=1 Tax=Bordetella bronchialis TaxID=463025 RepID=A0A193FSD6_9BORD|nr:hypothetical protein [Bordetella bronchialis]ANN65070.1 hypothetical protein BAU06_00950 [Bordetella bronchialis]ANN70101.1 hypothetical protein BAU08_00940 [Bordetella bronchialis]